MKTAMEDILPSHQSLCRALRSGAAYSANAANSTGSPAGQKPGATSPLQRGEILFLPPDSLPDSFTPCQNHPASLLPPGVLQALLIRSCPGLTTPSSLGLGYYPRDILIELHSFRKYTCWRAPWPEEWEYITHGGGTQGHPSLTLPEKPSCTSTLLRSHI